MLLTDAAIRIFRQPSPADVIRQFAREAHAVTQAVSVLASYLSANQQWAEGLHVTWSAAGAREMKRPVQSAAHAVYRSVHRSGKTVDCRRDDPAVPYAATLCDYFGEGADHVVGLPILTRSRIAGCCILVLNREPAYDAAALEGLARCATSAMANATRLAKAIQAEDRFSVLSEAAKEALWDWNLDTGSVWWSGGLWKLLGNGSELQPVSEWKFERIHDDDAERVRNSLRLALASNAAEWAEEYRFERGDGTSALVEDRAHIIRNGQGRAVRLIGTMRDVTEIKHLEEVRRTNEALEAAGVLKDQFISLLSHELRTPLNAIVGFAQLLDDGFAGPLNAKQQTFMRHVIKGGDSLLQLVNNLLDATRLRAGQFAIDPHPISLAHVVEEVVRTHAPPASEKGLALQVDMARDLPLVLADVERIEQVLSNLVSNAIKFSTVGSVRIVAAELPTGEVRCEVSDQGIGIDERDLARLFQLFSQVKDSAAPNGTGLGLFICKTLVEAHGGSIGVKSRRHEGSTFWFTLPAAPADLVERAS